MQASVGGIGVHLDLNCDTGVDIGGGNVKVALGGFGTEVSYNSVQCERVCAVCVLCVVLLRVCVRYLFCVALCVCCVCVVRVCTCV